jgi:S-adenosylmethionine:diacylglycerol 3-amino-3-carboxypropyl transferase
VRDEGSPWAGGHFGRGGRARILFGRMYEDAEVELAVFSPGARIFCVASAGCTAFALAGSGCTVTAVDLNPAQIAYVRSRLAGSPAVTGAAERLLGRLRRLAPLVGWKRHTLETFCLLDDCAEQRRFWDERLDTRRFRAALALVFRPLALRAVYAPRFLSALPPRFDRVLRLRLERGFATHSNRGNPYARQLLLGDVPALEPEQELRVDLQCADAAEYLERAAPESFDGFALSNVLDGANEAYGARLFAAVRRAAAPKAQLVLRSLREPGHPADADWAARDRSVIWGSIRIEEVA